MLCSFHANKICQQISFIDVKYFVFVANTSDLFYRYNSVSAHYKENEVSIQHQIPCLNLKKCPD